MGVLLCTDGYIFFLRLPFGRPPGRVLRAACCGLLFFLTHDHMKMARPTASIGSLDELLAVKDQLTNHQASRCYQAAQSTTDNGRDVSTRFGGKPRIQQEVKVKKMSKVLHTLKNKKRSFKKIASVGWCFRRKQEIEA